MSRTRLFVTLIITLIACGAEVFLISKILVSENVSCGVTDLAVIYSADELDAKKVKGDEEEEEEYNLADIAEGSVTSVRSGDNRFL